MELYFQTGSTEAAAEAGTRKDGGPVSFSLIAHIVFEGLFHPLVRQFLADGQAGGGSLRTVHSILADGAAIQRFQLDSFYFQDVPFKSVDWDFGVFYIDPLSQFSEFPDLCPRSHWGPHDRTYHRET